MLVWLGGSPRDLQRWRLVKVAQMAVRIDRELYMSDTESHFGHTRKERHVARLPLGSLRSFPDALVRLSPENEGDVHGLLIEDSSEQAG